MKVNFLRNEIPHQKERFIHSDRIAYSIGTVFLERVKLTQQ
ncbi:hypothetical protein [Calothrix sp. NIES-2098]